MKTKIVSSIALTGLLGGASMAYAAPVTWTLDNVTFKDTSSPQPAAPIPLTGSFIYDAVTNTLGAYSVLIPSSVSGAAIRRFTSSCPFGGCPVSTSPSQITLGNDLWPVGYSDRIWFFFTPALSDAGGTIDLVGSSLVDYTVFSGWPTLLLETGTVTAAPVPEPETYAMLLAGLGLLAFAARRRLG